MQQKRTDATNSVQPTLRVNSTSPTVYLHVSRDYHNSLPVMFLQNISRFGFSRQDAILITMTYNVNILFVTWYLCCKPPRRAKCHWDKFTSSNLVFPYNYESLIFISMLLFMSMINRGNRFWYSFDWLVKKVDEVQRYNCFMRYGTSMCVRVVHYIHHWTHQRWMRGGDSSAIVTSRRTN